MDTDTAIYAVIAIVLLGKLWSVLGRRNDNDKSPDLTNGDATRINPFAPKDAGKSAAKNASQDDDTGPYHPPVKTGNASGGPFNSMRPLIGIKAASDNTPPGIRQISHAPDSLAGGLEQIRATDATFDEKSFLQTARSTFTTIIEDFAKGDLTRAKRYLGPTVLPHFERAIAARQAAQQTMDGTLQRIRDADATAARLIGTQAFITVHFISEQKNTLRDVSGAPVDGTEGGLHEISDIWVFSRDLKLPKTDWLLVETRS